MATIIAKPESRARDVGALSLPAFVLDETGCLVWVNDAFTRLIPAWAADRRPAFLDLVYLEILAIRDDVDALQTSVREVLITDPEGTEGEYLLTLDAVPGPEAGWVGVLTEISHIRRGERNSEQHLRVEMLLSSISGRFVGTYDLRAAIEATLSDLGEYSGSDRVFVLVLSEDGEVYQDTYEWHRPDLDPVAVVMAGQPPGRMPWWDREQAGTDVLDIPDLAACPPQARQELADAGIEQHGAVVLMPLTVGDRQAGVVGLHGFEPRPHADLSSHFVLDIVCQTLQRALLLHRKESALQRSIQELQVKQAQLIQSEKMASIGQIAAGVAHEINNPIGFLMGNVSAMQSYTETLRGALAVSASLRAGQTPDPETLAGLDPSELAYIADDLDGILAESLEGCLRVRDIVENLKGFARIDQLQARPTDLNSCVESTLKIVWNELKYRCQVVKDLGELPLLTCFAGQINQVIMNLLVNAAHAIKTEGTVTITTRATADEIVLTVADTGIGIPPENVPRLFDPFFTTKDPGKGTGLGLYVCHGIVERHHGHFVVTSEVGKGTAMSVHLPLSGTSDGARDA